MVVALVLRRSGARLDLEGLLRKFSPTTERVSLKPHDYVKCWTCETIFDADTPVNNRIIVDIRMLINKATGEQNVLVSTSDLLSATFLYYCGIIRAQCFQRISFSCSHFIFIFFCLFS